MAGRSCLQGSFVCFNCAQDFPQFWAASSMADRGVNVVQGAGKAEFTVNNNYSALTVALTKGN